MACVRVFVDVLEVRIERVVIEIEIGVGVARALPGIGYVVNDFGVNDMRFAEFLIPSLWIGDGHLPVIAVVANGADQLVLGDDFERAREVGDKPILAGDGTRLALQLMLVVVHQDNAVGIV